MDKLFDIIVRSSGDPQKYSLTIKSTLLGFIPFLMQAIGFACAIGWQCVSVDANILQLIVDYVTQMVFWLLTITSIVGAAYGATRKLIKTIMGTNPVLYD